MEIPKRKLKMDVCTRWNSTYDMIERYCAMEPAIYATLFTPSLKKNIKDVVTLSDDDNQCLRDLIEVLLPMKNATVAMCDESIPTISMIAPLLYSLKLVMSPKEEDRAGIKEVKQVIEKDLNERYKDESVKETLNLSAALDPRFKSLVFLSADKKEEIISLLAVKAERQHTKVN